jgi:hypothetical protein
MYIFSAIWYYRGRPQKYWRDGRVVECIGLENRRTATYRGFESLSLRTENNTLQGVVFVYAVREETVWETVLWDSKSF